MSFTIAITGKGGVGKTTIAGLIVARLIERGKKPILAVDADPNTCLDAALGVQVTKTVGAVREDTRQIAGQGMLTGTAKQNLLNLKISQSLVESDDFDLIAMGRPEGPGCYCFANNVLRQTIGEIAKNYPYVVIDNEAGLENLSRRIVQKADVMIIVADPSRRGLETIKRLYDLAREMEVSFGKLAILVNRLRRDLTPDMKEQIFRHTGTSLIFSLPDDEELARADENGYSLRKLPPANAVVTGIDSFLTEIC